MGRKPVVWLGVAIFSTALLTAYTVQPAVAEPLRKLGSEPTTLRISNVPPQESEVVTADREKKAATEDAPSPASEKSAIPLAADAASPSPLRPIPVSEAGSSSKAAGEAAGSSGIEGLSPVAEEAKRPKLAAKATKPADLPSSETPPPAASVEPTAESLKPIVDPDSAGPVESEATSFKGVTPGTSKQADVEKAWGSPREMRKKDNALIQLYSVKPFEKVEVHFSGDTVACVVIWLEKAVPANAAAQQLGLSRIRPVLVSNDVGEILGQAYPERGVLFAFEPSGQPGKPTKKVIQLVIEPINAESFVLRAETYLETRYEFCRHDLEEALKLQPNNGRANWLLARVLVASGQHEKAATAAGEAVRLDPQNAQYRITRAQVLAQTGRLSEAVEEANRALALSQQRPHVKARALCLLGDLAASGMHPDYRRAVQYHMDALAAADPLITSRHPAIRLAAKEALIDAHLGAAHDIAWGKWKEKKEAVTRWLTRAASLAEEYVANDGGPEERRFRVAPRSLAACVGLRGQVDPQPWIKEALRTGEALIVAADDPLRKAQLQWDLGVALYDTLQTCQMRSEHDQALKYGDMAVTYLEQGEAKKQSPAATYMLGRLYFRMGAVASLRENNHAQAVTWFDKAIPLLEKPAPKDVLADLGRHGETFISMAVSYWESGNRRRAVELTARGVELMEEAARQGSMDASALSIPYANLAAMHRQLGAADKASRFEEMATRAKDSKVR